MLFIGILTLLGDIKLTDIKNRLYNTDTVWKYPLPIINYNQHSIAVFTAKFTPEQREKQLKILFDAEVLKVQISLAQQKRRKQKEEKLKKKKRKLHKLRKSKKG